MQTNHSKLQQARPDIYALTLLRAKEKPENPESIIFGFWWSNSPEGYKFWERIRYYEDYTHFDDLYGKDFSKKRPEGIEEFFDFSKSDCTIIGEEKELTIMEKWEAGFKFNHRYEPHEAITDLKQMKGGAYAVECSHVKSTDIYDEEGLKYYFTITPPTQYLYLRIDGDAITGHITTLPDAKANPRNGYVLLELNDLTEKLLK